MEEIRLKGIVVGSAYQGEYGRRLKLITDELGKITVFAQGAAKSGSKLIEQNKLLVSIIPYKEAFSRL